MVLDTTISSHEVKIAGRKIGEDLERNLALVRVEESLSLPASFTLRFYDQGFALLDRSFAKVGDEVEISLGWGGSLTRVLRGEVTAVSAEARVGRPDEIEIHGLDKMHRWMRGASTETYQNQSDADVARKIAQEAGLQAEVDPTGDPHDFLFRVNESAHSFLRKRARRIGFDYWVSENKLYFKRAQRSAPVSVGWGEALYRFKVRMSSAGYAPEVEARGWDPETQQAVAGTASSHPNAPSSAPLYTSTQSQASAFSNAKVTVSGLPVTSQRDATEAAKGLRHRLASTGLVARGEIDGAPGLGAGSTLNITGLGTRLSGQYLLTSVEHVLGAGQPYVTRFVSSGPELASFPDLVAGIVDATGQPRAGLNLSTGLVTNVNDPDKVGRVRLKLPAINEQNETGWVRVAASAAGPDAGFQALPSVNDEVLVGFEQGDASRPFVIGGLWSKRKKPPMGEYHQGGNAQRVVWRSRKGHEVQINDAGDGEVTVKLKGAKSEVKVTKSEVTITGDQKVKVAGSDIEVAATGKLTLKGRQVEVNGSQDVAVKGGMIKLN